MITTEDENFFTGQLQLPQTILNKKNTNSYILKESIKDNHFGYIYKGLNCNEQKDIIIKFISKNGNIMIKELDNLLNLCKESNIDSNKKNNINSSNPDIIKLRDNMFVDILEINLDDEAKNSFMVIGKKLNNLVDLVGKVNKYEGWKNFYFYGLEMLEYLHKKGVIVDNLKTTSFWWKPSQDSSNYEHVYSELLLADFEFWCRFETSIEKDKINPQILDISKKRLSSQPISYMYCALGRQNGEIGCAKFDYESLFYIYLELINGKLPWSSFNGNITLVHNVKTAMRTPYYHEFENLDMNLYDILHLIDQMTSHTPPNISKLYNKFSSFFQNPTNKKQSQNIDNINNTDNDNYFTFKARVIKTVKYPKEEKILKEYFDKEEKIRNKKTKSVILEEKKIKMKKTYEHEIIEDPFEGKIKDLNNQKNLKKGILQIFKKPCLVMTSCQVKTQ